MADYFKAQLALLRADAEKQIQFHANRRLSMTNQQHPITPPPELVREWIEPSGYKVIPGWLHELLQTATQWGADQELEACSEWLKQQTLCGHRDLIPSLHTARRPKPPSLKEQALAELAEWENICNIAPDSPIRRALEQLDD